VKEFIAAGGLIKNKFVMQIYADVLNMPITVIRSSQGPALGSAIHAAVAAGAYKDVVAASAVMGGVEQIKFNPDVHNARVYDELYRHYSSLYEEFGQNNVMHDLRRIRDVALMEIA
jgi:L-ribulokinase